MSDENRMNLDRVESWRTRVENSIDAFLKELPVQVSEKLDYSVDSLDVFEAWLLDKYSPSETTPDPSQLPIDDGAMFYVGETFKKHLGGYWNVHFANVEPDYRYGEDPVIEGFAPVMAINPWILIGVALEKVEGKYLSRLLKSLIDLYITRRRGKTDLS